MHIVASMIYRKVYINTHVEAPIQSHTWMYLPLHMYTYPAGLVSTEEEDDTPYDMYTKPEQEEGGERSEASEEGEGEGGETKEEKREGDQQLEENIVTDLVITLALIKGVAVYLFCFALKFSPQDADQSPGEKEEEEEEEKEEEHDEEGEKLKDEEKLKEKERLEPAVLKVIILLGSALKR